MKVNFKAPTNIKEFGSLEDGAIFSYDDYSGLFLKTDYNEAFDFKTEGFVEFDSCEKVIRREISVTIEDGLPFQD